VDFIDESEVLTPADEVHHINKKKFKVRKNAPKGPVVIKPTNLNPGT